MAFGQVGIFIHALQVDEWQHEFRERRTVAVNWVIAIFCTAEKLADVVGVDGLIRVHRPDAELRQADGERKQRD